MLGIGYLAGISMPAYPRSHIVHSGQVGVFHCWNRCVRRAFLCGIDRRTRKNFNYRRRWIRKQEQQLAKLFAIDIAFRSELSNHIHLILRTRPDVAATWSDEEAVRRWLQIAQLKRGCRAHPTEPSAATIHAEMARQGRVKKLRHRLSCVSWFMGALCENIARRSNREDDCTGKFWESRFTCRKLVSESAILICGIYVDLNPIRAGETSVPEQAIHTSAFDRILGRTLRTAASRAHPTGVNCRESIEFHAPALASACPSAEPPPDGWLCELTLASGVDADVRAGATSTTPWRASDKGILPISLDEYLKLLDWTGRKVVAGKRGSIPAELAPILDRLDIDASGMRVAFAELDKKFARVRAGVAGVVQKAFARLRRWLRGTGIPANPFEE